MSCCWTRTTSYLWTRTGALPLSKHDVLFFWNYLHSNILTYTVYIYIYNIYIYTYKHVYKSMQHLTRYEHLHTKQKTQTCETRLNVYTWHESWRLKMKIDHESWIQAVLRTDRLNKYPSKRYAISRRNNCVWYVPHFWVHSANIIISIITLSMRTPPSHETNSK